MWCEYTRIDYRCPRKAAGQFITFEYSDVPPYRMNGLTVFYLCMVHEYQVVGGTFVRFTELPKVEPAAIPFGA